MATVEKDMARSGSSSGKSSEQAEHNELKHNTLAHTATMEQKETNFEAPRAGMGALYDAEGNLRLLPAPTNDPRDPLNLAPWHKFIGLGCVTLMGALAASAEIILGALLPVFALYYSNIDPGPFLVTITSTHLLQGIQPLPYLATLTGDIPIWQIWLLGSLPLFVIGACNLFLVPLAVAVGRRPVLICAGLVAIAGALWAGYSDSLGTHIGARCIQAVGAGTVESLIPFIIQDMCHFHKRNTYIAAAFAAQGVIIIALGISAPRIIYHLTWRYMYFITAAGAGFFILMIIFFMPETRYYRTKDELNGIPRPDEAERVYEPRTWRYNLALTHDKAEWKKGVDAFVDSLRTFFYPQIFFITLLNSAMIGAGFAAAFTTTPLLVGEPYYWSFFNLGLCLVPVLIGAICVGVISGGAADWTANYFAKVRGRRLPENQLINLALPAIVGLVGSILFGICGDNPDKYPWPLFLFSLGLLAFGFLGCNSVGAVYVLECYPQLAGPALVNIASFRWMVAFALSFKVTDWIIDFGYLNTMAIYTGIIGFFTLCLPFVYIFGPGWRKRWPGPDRW